LHYFLICRFFSLSLGEEEMAISIDQALCSGCGLCIELCPEAFTWGSDGKVQAVKDECELHSLEEIADQCPMEAINI
jgi:ferredoxin